MIRKVALIAWAIFSVGVAANSSLMMFVTFAPNQTIPPECRPAELHGIERVRDFWSGGAFQASGLLVMNTAALVALGWRGRTMQSSRIRDQEE